MIILILEVTSVRPPPIHGRISKSWAMDIYLNS